MFRARMAAPNCEQASSDHGGVLLEAAERVYGLVQGVAAVQIDNDQEP